MENRFQVIEQAKPTRCEICHQADQFDARTETCFRCQALILTQALPEEEAERYRRRQEAGLTVPRDTKVPVSDLFLVIPEAVKLCRRNFALFFSIIAAVTLPAALIGLLPNLVPNLIKVNPLAYLSLVALSVLASIVFYPIGMGALTKAILDRYRGEPASFVNSFQFILDRGWRFLVTSILGNLYMTVGFMFCLVGGVFTFPRSLFIPDVSIVEEKYFGAAFKRADQLGKINSGMLLLFGLLWVIVSSSLAAIPAFITGLGAAIIIMLKLASLMLPLTILSHLLGSLVGMLVTPLAFATKLLLYFHLRMRTEEVKFPVEAAKKGELAAPAAPVERPEGW